jgi:hypothetical protein
MYFQNMSTDKIRHFRNVGVTTAWTTYSFSDFAPAIFLWQTAKGKDVTHSWMAATFLMCTLEAVSYSITPKKNTLQCTSVAKTCYEWTRSSCEVMTSRRHIATDLPGVASFHAAVAKFKSWNYKCRRNVSTKCNRIQKSEPKQTAPYRGSLAATYWKLWWSQRKHY